MKREVPDELLSAYLDGELSMDERAAVEAEIAANADARQVLDELRAVSGQVRELPRHAAGPEFADRVVEAAVAARAQGNYQGNGAALLPRSNSDLAPSPVHRRRAIVPAALAGLAAVAAAIALAVWIAQGGNQGGPGSQLAVHGDPGPAAAISEAAQQALAHLRQTIPQEGEAIVVRLRFGATRQELDAALAAAGIVSRLENDGSTGAMGYGKAYHDKLLEKFGGQPGVVNQAWQDGTIAPADAMFVEAPLAAIEKAIASLTCTPESVLELSPVMNVAAAKIAGDPGEIGHGEAAPQSTGAAPKFYAQRLNPGMFRLEKTKQSPTTGGPAPAATVDATRPIRMLILIEPAQ